MIPVYNLSRLATAALFRLHNSQRICNSLVASLGLVSPGAATDRVTYFSPKTHFFCHRPLQSDRLFSFRMVTTPTFRRRLSSVLSKFSHYFFIRVHPLDSVTRGVPPPPISLSPSDATVTGSLLVFLFHVYLSPNVFLYTTIVVV